MSHFVDTAKYIQFTVTEEERNQKIFTFYELESENVTFLILKMTHIDKLVIKMVAVACKMTFSVFD